jgi:hypothetical protein
MNNKPFIKNLIRNLIREELNKLNEIQFDEFNFDPENNIYDKRELEDLERQSEGRLPFKDVVYLTPWLWTNPEINEKIKQHDELENKKIPRLRYSSMDTFKDIIFDNIRIKNNKIYGFNNATKDLSDFFGIDDTLSKIELGKLIQNKLEYSIIN